MAWRRWLELLVTYPSCPLLTSQIAGDLTRVRNTRQGYAAAPVDTSGLLAYRFGPTRVGIHVRLGRKALRRLPWELLSEELGLSDPQRLPPLARGPVGAHALCRP